MTDAPRPDTTGTGGTGGTGGTALKSLAFRGPGMDNGTGTGGTGTGRESEAVPVVPAAVTGLGPENDHASNVVPAQNWGDRRGLIAAMAALFPCPAAVIPPDLDAFEERAAIAEHDGGLSRAAAERLAAEAEGFADPAALHAAAVERWRLALDALALRETSHRGREHVAHARAFVAGGWAAQAAALGWTEPELFGLCPAAPWALPDRMGAAWLGGDVAAVTAKCVTLVSGLRVWRASRANGLRVPW